MFIGHEDKVSGAIETVSEHLKATAQLSGKLASKVGMEKAGYVSGLLHDFGKYSDDFQARIQHGGAICDHSTAGAQLIRELLGYGLPSDLLSVCMMSHHGGLLNMVEADGSYSVFERRMLANVGVGDLRTRGVEHLADVIAHREVLLAEFSALFAKLDGLNAPKSRENLFFQALLVKFLYSCLIDADRLCTIAFSKGLSSTESVPWDVLARAVDSYVAGFEQCPLSATRSEVYVKCLEAGKLAQGIYKLTAPTGAGKTLSSLRFAIEQAKQHNLDRVIYVLPYTSIIEQNAEVVRDLLKAIGVSADILLESHSNVDIEESNRYNGAVSNWDIQIVFTTTVSFYESVYSGGTKRIRRFHNLANSVVIFDEVQALPIKLVQMSNMLLRFLTEVCGSTVVLCSATQPMFDLIPSVQRRLPVAASIVELNRTELDRVNIVDARSAGGYRADELSSMLLAEFAKVSSVLCVVNTRTTAFELFIALQSCGVNVYHLSTYLCAAHRSDVLKRIKADMRLGKKVICVSTQLIEAGVHIDFDSVFRMEAGVDSILQCAGRCNREGLLKDASGNSIRGTLYIVNSADENVSSLVDIKKGQEVLRRVLRDFGGVLSAEALDYYYTHYFHLRGDEMAYKVPSKQVGVTTDLFELFSANFAGCREYLRDGRHTTLPKLLQAFGTVGAHFSVIGSEQVGIIVPYGKGKDLIANLESYTLSEVSKKAQRYTVNVFRNQLSHLPVKYSCGVAYVDEEQYDSVLGCALELLTFI